MNCPGTDDGRHRIDCGCELWRDDLDRHLVQYSTGTSSAEVAHRVIEKHGVDAVTLLTADTLIEDDDNWRFATEAWEWLGQPEWIRVTDGRNPMQVGRDRRIVPNNQMAACSLVLKRQLLRRWIDSNCAPADTVVHLGFDWLETKRWDDAQKWWPPYRVAAPLMDPPNLHKLQIFDLWRGRGIEIPELNRRGFPHANCGGGCVRAGQAEWARLLHTYPERYEWWEAEEQETRVMLGKDVSILKDRRGGEGQPMTLRAFRERLTETPTLFGPEDMGACACDSYQPDETPPTDSDRKYAVDRKTPAGWEPVAAVSA